MTAPRTQTTRAKGLFITNETAPLLGAVTEGAEEDPVDEGPDEGPDEVALMVLFPPRLVVLSGYPPVLVVVPLEGAVVEVTMVLLL